MLPHAFRQGKAADGLATSLRAFVGFSRLRSPLDLESIPGMLARVLVVDDDPTFRALVCELLQDRGYEVVGMVENAEAALAAVRVLRPTAVLADVHLPEHDGLWLAAELTAMHAPPAVVLMSADAIAASADVVRQCGAEGFVPKTELAVTDLAPLLGR